MPFKVDKQGRKYVHCRGDGNKWTIYNPICYFGQWVVTKTGIENFRHYRNYDFDTILYVPAHNPRFVEEYSKGWEPNNFKKAVDYATRYYRRLQAELQMRRRGLVPKRSTKP